MLLLFSLHLSLSLWFGCFLALWPRAVGKQELEIKLYCLCVHSWSNLTSIRPVCILYSSIRT